MWRCVVLALTNVSEERIASIFRVEKSASGEPVSAGGCRLSHQLVFVSASHGSLSSAPSRNLLNMTPDLQGYNGQYALAIYSPVAAGSMLAQ
jgi:hypothetical protein